MSNEKPRQTPPVDKGSNFWEILTQWGSANYWHHGISTWLIWFYYALFDPTFYDEKISAQAFEELFIRLHPRLPKIGWASWSLQAWLLALVLLPESWCERDPAVSVLNFNRVPMSFQNYFQILHPECFWMLDAWDKSMHHLSESCCSWEV